MGQIPAVPQKVGLFFVFLLQFGLQRAAPFVSSPIHLFTLHSEFWNSDIFDTLVRYDCSRLLKVIDVGSVDSLLCDFPLQCVSKKNPDCYD